MRTAHLIPLASLSKLQSAAMEALAPISNSLFRFTPSASPNGFPLAKPFISRPKTTIAALNDVASQQLAADPSQLQITWQIAVGAIAGVTPFVVAGIEFTKRIVAQQRCEECGGSGLVLREDDYFRCPQCGGFLPWQSWKRFFWG